MKSDLGNLYSVVHSMAKQSRFDLSYLSRDWADLEQWRSTARAKLHEWLSYTPAASGSSYTARTVSIRDRDGYTEEEIELPGFGGLPVRGLFLTPKLGEGPFPCIIAIHDHGGFFYYGKEKIVETDDEPPILSELKQRFYGGRSWASVAARRGYAVFIIDGFYFGNRRLDMTSVSDHMLKRCPLQLREGMDIDEYIRTCNKIAGYMEATVVKYLWSAGTTWPGVLFYDDRRSVDYVLTRPEVDPGRIGCCGLSIGALRSLYLLALDPRIHCAAATGFMIAYEPQLFDRIRDHTFMIYVPQLYAHLDLPDVAGLSVPVPLLIQQCMRDELFTVDAMKQGADKLKAIYQKAGAEHQLAVTWHDVLHCFNESMQIEAFEWFDRWL